MRALIIDDEAPARAALRGALRAHPEILIVGEADTIDSGIERLGTADYDLVLLDVHLLGGTGFDLVPHVHADARIIFITASDQHAVRAFEVNALDYLMKPIRPQRLAETLRRLVSATAGPAQPEAAAPPAALQPGDSVYLRIGNGTSRFVPLADIAAITANENYSDTLLANGKRLLVRRTMKTWEDTLPAAQFVRVHRGTIVNLDRYRGADRQTYETTLLHLDGLPEPVKASYRYLPEVRARLTALGRQF